MQRFWPVALSVALCAAAPLPALAQPGAPLLLAAGAKVHPHTQQTYDQWLAQMGAAEAASRPGGDPEAAQKALEKYEEWFKEKKQVLERHPSYTDSLGRGLMLRLKLTKLVAFSAVFAAELAVKNKRPDFIDGRDGAYERLARADALAESIAAIVGKDQEAYTGVVAFVDQMKAKVKEKSASMQVGGISNVLPPGTKLHSFTVMTFNTWLENIAADKDIATGAQPLEKKIKELEGGRRWFMSNQQELRKHPNFNAGMEQMAGILLSLGELKAQQAVAFAEKGLKEMNANYFSESSGTYQTLREAERLLAEGKIKGESSSEYQRTVKAIADAGVAIGRVSEQYNKKAAASFRLPADQYRAGDKGQLKALVTAKWKALYPADRVLEVRFPKGAWERRNEWNWNNGSWYHYDNSSLLVYVVIKKNNELATVYPAYVNKDHSNGAVKVGAETKGSGYSHQDMLLANLKR